MVNVLLDEDRVDLGAVADHVAGVDALPELAAPFTPAAVAPVCGIAAEDLERMARELADAPRAVVYGRIGTCTQEFGTLASWLVDVLNVLTGNLDRPGRRDVPARGRRREQHERHARPRARAGASAAGRAACAGSAKCSASCRSPASRRRSTRPARARCAR